MTLKEAVLIVTAVCSSIDNDNKIVDTEAKKAERTASEWWSEHFRGEPNLGAAWYNADAKCFYVGVCDGHADKPGYTRIIEGGPGAYYNKSWDARFKAPDGSFYKNAIWFGRSEKSYADALFQARTRHGYPPMRH